MQQTRPKIICHMTSSIDGRLHPSRWTPPAPGIERAVLSGHYEELAERFSPDGWMVGRTTMAEIVKNEGAPSDEAHATGLRETHVAAVNGRRLAVGIDPRGKLRYSRDEAGGDHLVTVLSQRVSDAYLAELRRAGVSYLFAGPDGADLAQAMQTLGTTFGVKTLLLEGGARINGAFLKAGLIDEISLLVYPGIDALSGVPTVFEAAGAPDDRPARGQALRHLATETLDGGAVWLRYAVERVQA